jgi:hypothetical protein
MANVLAIPDLHVPFQHKDALAFLKGVRKHYRTDQTVCLGDEVDAHALSMHDHDPDGKGANDEYEAAMAGLQPFYEAFPVCVSMHSNHTARPFRRASKFGIPSVYLRSYAEFMCAPKGWTWHESIEVDDVRYSHGEGYSGPLGALKCAQAHMQSVVIGHLHSYAGVLWNANPKYLFAGLNAGCLIDRHAYAFQYAKHTPAKPILGCGVIREGVPQFVPMSLDKAGRWTGDL